MYECSVITSNTNNTISFNDLLLITVVLSFVVFNALKHSRYCKYKKLLYAVRCIYVLVILKGNCDYFLKYHYLINLCNIHMICLL